MLLRFRQPLHHIYTDIYHNSALRLSTAVSSSVALLVQTISTVHSPRVECSDFLCVLGNVFKRVSFSTLFLSLFILSFLFWLLSFKSSSRLTSLLLSSTFLPKVLSNSGSIDVSADPMTSPGALVTSELLSCRTLPTVPRIRISVSGVRLT